MFLASGRSWNVTMIFNTTNTSHYYPPKGGLVVMGSSNTPVIQGVLSLRAKHEYRVY